MAKLEDRIEIANPTQPHCATVLLVDTSSSMSGEKITRLNEGLVVFKDGILADPEGLASKRVDLAVISFGESVKVIHDFSTIDEFDPPTLRATGSTPMGEAILWAADLIEQRKQQYNAQGIDYFRPWIFLITDGEPTDMEPGDAHWNQVTKRVHDGEANSKFMFFAVAVEPANTETLAQIAPPNRPPIKLKGKMFIEMFQWLSRSQSRASAASVGDQVPLENPVVAGWGEVSV